MATTKTTTPRKRTTKTTGTRTTRTTTAKPRATSAKTDDTIVARTGRTIKERPYTSAAIATGAVTVVAAAAAAGAFLMSRRDKSFKEASEELTTKVKDGLASATETVKGGLASATETVKDLGQRGTDYFKGDGSDTGTETRTQQQIAEEALTLRETGAAKSPVDALSATEIKTGAVAY
ncbi:MAG: hypothetical protein LH466_10100 [Sphingomonas bacterium]|nr:hypothetical protein [Sphingomonas bacterium]